MIILSFHRLWRYLTLDLSGDIVGYQPKQWGNN